MYKLDRLTQRFTEFESAIEGTSSYGSTGERITFIKEGIEFFSHNPFLGSGINTFMVMDKTHHYSHNNYIELLVGMGLVGFFIYYMLHIMIFIKINRINNANKMKVLLILSLIIFLVMDMTLVSYSYKLIVFMLFFLSVYIQRQIDEVYK